MRHIDHVELAWRLLGQASFDDALSTLEAQLRAVASAAGKPEKYDREMSRGYLELIAESRRPNESFAAFAARNQELLLDGERTLTRRPKKLCLAFPPC